MRKQVLAVIALLAVLVVSFPYVRQVQASPSTAKFSGIASVHLVFLDGTQAALSAPFSVLATAGGPGAGTLFLTLTGLASPFPASVTVGGAVASGLISVATNAAIGGGTLAPPQPSQEGFAVTVQSGGQFQCQNAGFSALLSMGIRQMDVHGTVAPGTLVVS